MANIFERSKTAFTNALSRSSLLPQNFEATPFTSGVTRVNTATSEESTSKFIVMILVLIALVTGGFYAVKNKVFSKKGTRRKRR